MKRFVLAALGAAVLLGLSGCDVFGTTEKKNTGSTAYTFPSGSGTGGTTSTEWWIKGSFDDWKGGDDFGTDPTDGSRHFLSSDALNANLLSLTDTVLTGLTQKPYEFVLINKTEGKKYDFKFSDVDMMADNTPYHLVNSADKLGSFNAAFIASATTYKILVDVAKAGDPVIKLVPGSTPTETPATPTVADLAAALKIKGDIFSIGWTDTDGTLSGNTVTFSGLNANDVSGLTGSFGFASSDGFLKTDASITSPAALNGTTASLKISPRANANIKIASIPNQDSEYSVAVTLDPSKGAYSGRYTMVITLTSVGTTAWPDPVDTTIATTVMTNGTGAGNSWGAQLGDISTAVSGGKLYVKVHFSAVDKGNNVYLLLDNSGVTTGATDLSGDLTTGWGSLGLTANTASFNPDLVVFGSRDGGTAAFSLGGAKVLTGTTGTATTQVATANANSNADIWFRIPLSVLGLDATNNTLKAVVLFGKDTGAGGLHSAIPASIDTTGYDDVDSVASVTLTGL